MFNNGYIAEDASYPAEEVHIRELLHLLHIYRFDHFLVVVENPRLGPFVGYRLAYERNVVPALLSAKPFSGK